MAKRIGVLEADQSLDASPRSHVSKNAAAYLVRKVLAAWVPGRRVIQKLSQKSPEIAEQIYREVVRWIDGPLGVGNVLPFSRQSDGGRLHYEMPHAGDIGLWRHLRKRISVSARPDSQTAASFIGPRTRPFAFSVSPNALQG